MEILKKITLVIAIIGALNWGLIGITNFNLVETLFGTGTFTTIIYILVGVSGLFNISILFDSLK